MVTGVGSGDSEGAPKSHDRHRLREKLQGWLLSGKVRR
jgi:hypothetical protein